jgi:hypothetical protein
MVFQELRKRNPPDPRKSAQHPAGTTVMRNNLRGNCSKTAELCQKQAKIGLKGTLYAHRFQNSVAIKELNEIFARKNLENAPFFVPEISAFFDGFA